MAAIGVDGNGDKHVLAVVEGATENTVVRSRANPIQALIDNLLARGLDPTLPRLFIVDGAKALSKAIRNTFGVAAAIHQPNAQTSSSAGNAVQATATSMSWPWSRGRRRTRSSSRP